MIDARRGGCWGICRRAGFRRAWRSTATPCSWPTPRATAPGPTVTAGLGGHGLWRAGRGRARSPFFRCRARRRTGRAHGFRDGGERLRRRARQPPPLPEGIRHVVLIVKENRTYDEVLGDETEPPTGRRWARPLLARFGTPRLRGRAQAAPQPEGCQRDAQPPRHRRAVDLQRQFLRRFRRQRGRPPLAGGCVPRRLDRDLADGGVQRAEEGFPIRRPRPGGWSLPGSDSSVHPEDQLEGGTIWHHFARHGVSFLQFRRRLRTGGRGRRARIWSPPARASSPTCPCPSRSTATPRASIRAST